MNSSQINYYITQLIDKYKLDLSGKIVLTEAASGSYIFNSAISILAGAKETISFCMDSKYGSASQVRDAMFREYKRLNISDKINFKTELTKEILNKADIVTNSGHLRPINNDFIDKLKSSAVISLMWEPWELRNDEFDIRRALEREILVMGTNEHNQPCDMRTYGFLTAIKLMSQHKASIVDDNILIIGNQKTLALPIEDNFKKIGVNCKRIPTSANPEEIVQSIKWASYLLIAEHGDDRLIIGKNGIISDELIINSNIAGIGVITGQIEIDKLKSHNISIYPKEIAPKGYMSFQPSELGPYPVMDLFSAGLKVGEAMSSARKNDLSLINSAIYALENSPAMDLEGELAWIK